MPTTSPIADAATTGHAPPGTTVSLPNTGPVPIINGRHAQATRTATTTGEKMRAFHSHNSTSMASRDAARGVLSQAVTPATATATRSVSGSAAYSRNPWAKNALTAHHVMVTVHTR